MRKLLWTLGCDPSFENPNNASAMNVTPQNFSRVCDRFAIVCNEEQAKEIFSSHGLSPEGCNIYNLATSLNNAKPPYPNTGRRKQLAPVAVPKRVPDAPEPTIGDRFRFARKLASSLPPIGSD